MTQHVAHRASDEIAQLNAEIDRLRAELEKLRASPDDNAVQLHKVAALATTLNDENDRLRAENAELRLILETILNGSGYPSYTVAEQARAILTKTAKEKSMTDKPHVYDHERNRLRIEIDRLRAGIAIWKDRATRGREIIAEHYPAMEDAASQIDRLRADNSRLETDVIAAAQRNLDIRVELDRLREENAKLRDENKQLRNWLKDRGSLDAKAEIDRLRAGLEEATLAKAAKDHA